MMKRLPHFVLVGLLLWPSCMDIELDEQVGTEVGNPVTPDIDKDDPAKPEVDSFGMQPKIDDSLVTLVQAEDGTLEIVGAAHAVVPAGARLRGVVLAEGQYIHEVASNSDGSFALPMIDGDVESAVRFHAQNAIGRSAVVQLSFAPVRSAPDLVLITSEHTRAAAPCLSTSSVVAEVGAKAVGFTLRNTCSEPVTVSHKWQFGDAAIQVDLPEFLDANEAWEATLTASATADFDLLLIYEDENLITPHVVVTVFPPRL